MSYADSTGLILLTGGQRSLLDAFVVRSQDQAAIDWLETLKTVFPERLYIELQQHHSQGEIHARKLVKTPEV